MVKRLYFWIILILIAGNLNASPGIISGGVFDKKTGESIIGATVLVGNTGKGAVTDLDGQFILQGIPEGRHKIKVSFLSYQPAEMDVEIVGGQTTQVRVEMLESSTTLDEVTILSVRKTDTEMAMLSTMKASLNVVSGVSAQQISLTQDKDASEVVKRIPGISVIDDKFVIARGLSQRYNNVWINNSAVPSSEADSRSFSFDIIPSSQIDNIVIVKSPSPELPADFSGGFIKVMTKSLPSDNSFQISYGDNYNTQTHFRDFLYAKGSATDFLGFDNGFRQPQSFVPERLDNNNSAQIDRVSKSGFNNDWTIRNRKPLFDQRFSANLNRKWITEDGRQFGFVAALNYGYSTRTYTDMDNSRFGVYNSLGDKPVYLYRYTDNLYNTEAKLGALLNLSFTPNSNHCVEFRNIFNQLGKDRYTQRSGFQYISGEYIQEKEEYIYNSRAAYSGQLAGRHTFYSVNQFDWTLGFSYSDKKQPDRRIIEREENGFVDDPHFGMMRTDQNDIFRDNITLDEYSYTLSGNYSREFDFGTIFPILKTGIYTEYKDRDYKTRAFYYRWNAERFPSDFSYNDVVTGILIPENFGAGKLYLYEDTDNRDSYMGRDGIASGYLALNLPFGKWSVYAGARAEYNNMEVINYTTIKGNRTKTRRYEQFDIFPSVNASYNFDKRHILRAAYGMSVNRQEFRELSPSVYYDFDLFSSIKGNPNLKPAKIHNADLRYEWYPSPSELVSVALFYKYFINPIEWTYRDAGGSYIYTFDNAETAGNAGLEIDIKKSLNFIGLNDFILSFNGSLIDSKVSFGANSLEYDRPMQGQSPYLVNTGLFYRNEKAQLNLGLLYNIIGKRIVGIGKADTSDGGSINNDVPDMYEMPRNTLDFTFSKKFGIMEISGGIRDILAEDVVFKQFPKFYDSNGDLQIREQTTKCYRPGRNISLTVKLNF